MPLSSDQLAVAEKYASHLKIKNATSVQEDVLAVLNNEKFGVVMARFVLIHIKDPLLAPFET